MRALTNSALDRMIAEIGKYKDDASKRISISPTHLIMFRYPGETVKEFRKRVAWAKRVAKRAASNP